MDLAKNAMLVSLNITKWAASKKDERIIQSAATAHNATEKVLRGSKLLISRDALTDIRKAHNAARTYYYSVTLEWNEGQRILPTKLYTEFAQKMGQYKVDFETAVSSFVANYQNYIAEMKANLGGLFNGTDYPLDIESKFTFDVSVQPMPLSNDFRIELGRQELEELKRQLNENNNKRLQAATKEAFEKLHKVVNHMATTLSDPEKGFHGSLVGNIKKLTDLLPILNVTNDKDLSDLVNEVKSKLTDYDPDTLKTDMDVRDKAADEATQISNKIKSSINRPSWATIK